MNPKRGKCFYSFRILVDILNLPGPVIILCIAHHLPVDTAFEYLEKKQQILYSHHLT